MTANAMAGTFIKSITQDYTNKDIWFYSNLAIQQGKMRVDVQGPDFLTAMLANKKEKPLKPEMTTWTVLFDQTTSQLDLVLPAQKAIYELTGTDFAQIKNYLAPFVLEMNQALKDPRKMKKKDRAEYEKFKVELSKLLDYAPGPDASGVTVNGYVCEQYNFREKKMRMMDYWCLPASANPMSPEDFETWKALLNLFIDTFGDFLTAIGVDPEKLKKHPYLNKVPICSITYGDNGKPKECNRLLALKSVDFPPNTFFIPTSYQKTDVLDIAKAFGKPAASKKN